MEVTAGGMRDRTKLEQACALAIQGWACVDVTQEDVDDDDSGHVEVGNHLVGTHIAQCIPTGYVTLGYKDVVRHAKGILDGTPTVALGDYGGGIELTAIDYNCNFTFDDAVDEECNAGDEEEFNGPLMEQARLALFGYERDGGDIQGPIDGRARLVGTFSGPGPEQYGKVTMKEMREALGA